LKNKPKIININEIKPTVLEGGGRSRRVVTKKNLGAHMVFAVVFEDPGEGHTWHTHPADEVIYIIRGRGTLTFVDNGNKSLEAKEGDVVYIPMNVKHQFINTGTEPMMLVAALAPPFI
jgi:quercetin dioxygenase-like cupin family protein